MKNLIKLSVWLVGVGTLISSCASPYYYQVAHIKYVDKGVIKQDGSLQKVAGDIVISYDFWEEYGRVAFKVTNNSNQDMVIYMDKSFFIRNGMAYDYYSGDFKKNQSIKMIVPSKSSRIINQYDIANFMYRSCDLYLYNLGKLGQDSISFEKETSPLKFENRLQYSYDDSDKLYRLDSEFYVDYIINMKDKKFRKQVEVISNCPDESIYSSTKPLWEWIDLVKACDKYYIMYDKETYYGWPKH